MTEMMNNFIDCGLILSFRYSPKVSSTYLYKLASDTICRIMYVSQRQQFINERYVELPSRDSLQVVGAACGITSDQLVRAYEDSQMGTYSRLNGNGSCDYPSDLNTNIRDVG